MTKRDIIKAWLTRQISMNGYIDERLYPFYCKASLIAPENVESWEIEKFFTREELEKIYNLIKNETEIFCG